MRLHLHRQDSRLSDGLRDYIERRLLFALSRFGNRLRRVDVHLANGSGKAGGLDKRCRMVAQLVPSGQVLVEVRDAEWSAAVDRMADRLGQAVGRELERWRHGRRLAKRMAHLVGGQPSGLHSARRESEVT